MVKNILFVLFGLFGGILAGLALIFLTPFFASNSPLPLTIKAAVAGPKQVIGFLPYWLLDRAKTDYSGSVTTLSYFALRISSDGSIQKLTKPTEEEPGWYALESGKVSPFLTNALKNNVALSLVLDSGDSNAIDAIIQNPVKNGKTLVTSVLPIMKQYGFSDLNLDIEYTQPASNAARQNFTKLIQTVRNNLPKENTLTLEISPIDATTKQLIDIHAVAQFATYIVLMAYDYHAPDSFVTGPVAPLFGAGETLEYDVATAVEKTLGNVSPTQLILGMPLYGYEWEILGSVPRSAVLPGSGVLASSNRIATFLASCATCSAQFDSQAQESFVFYQSSDTNTNHLIFIPDEKSTSAKIAFAKKNSLAGVALWALGYEDDTILQPITTYKNN